MYLENNTFTGTLPSEWSAFTSLRQLHLQNNKLSGELPKSWSAMKELIVLCAPISFLGALGFVARLKHLLHRCRNLDENDLDGDVPTEWCSMVEEGSLRDLQTDTEHGLFRSINCCFDRADTRIKVPRFLCSKSVSGSMIFLPIQAAALLAVLVMLRGTPLFLVIKVALSMLDSITDISYLVRALCSPAVLCALQRCRHKDPLQSPALPYPAPTGCSPDAAAWRVLHRWQRRSPTSQSSSSFSRFMHAPQSLPSSSSCATPFEKARGDGRTSSRARFGLPAGSSPASSSATCASPSRRKSTSGGPVESGCAPRVLGPMTLLKSALPPASNTTFLAGRTRLS